MRFPQRAFDFWIPYTHPPPSNRTNVVVNQSLNGVFGTVWDAEVLLAHYLERHVVLKPSDRVLELGAGTALAAILCRKRSCRVVVQETRFAISHTAECLKMNLCEDVGLIAANWAEQEEFVPVLQEFFGRGESDFVLMADVFYHPEDFPTLLSLVNRSLIRGGSLVLCFEQRRRRLNELMEELSHSFGSGQVVKYEIPSDQSYKESIENHDIDDKTCLYLLHLTNKL